MSAPKIMDVHTKKCFFLQPGGEKLFDPWASGRKGQECPQEIRTKNTSAVPQSEGPNDRSGDGTRTVTQMLWTSVGQSQLSFVQVSSREA